MDFNRSTNQNKSSSKNKYFIYTDGSCLNNPGHGGYAGIILDKENNKIDEISGGELQTTNNRMELQAVIEILKRFKNFKKVHKQLKAELFTDSRYVQKGISEWISKWRKNNWKTANKKEVKNLDLWQKLDFLNSNEISWEWIKAHNGNKWNEYVDDLARKCAEGI